MVPLLADGRIIGALTAASARAGLYRAAARLGFSRFQLYHRLKPYQIEPD